jgi:hypothetical protein
MKVAKYKLLLIAGGVWSAAGLSVTSIGVQALLRSFDAFDLPIAAAVFAVFYFLIFSRLVAKHDRRIEGFAQPRLPFYRFFDLPSYAIMVFMMTGGILLRTSGLVEDGFVGPFYTGLGLALFLCGLRFFALYPRKVAIERA